MSLLLARLNSGTVVAGTMAAAGDAAAAMAGVVLAVGAPSGSSDAAATASGSAIAVGTAAASADAAATAAGVALAAGALVAAGDGAAALDGVTIATGTLYGIGDGAGALDCAVIAVWSGVGEADADAVLVGTYRIIVTTGVRIPARVVPYTIPAAVVPYTVAAAVVPYQITAAVVPYTVAAAVVPYVIPGGTMSNGTIPRGPALEFARGGSKPCVFPLTAGGTTPYSPTGTLVLRIGRNAADALYEVDLDAITAPNWSCTAAPDIAAGSYAYWVVDVVADAPDGFLCTGSVTIIDAVGPAA